TPRRWAKSKGGSARPCRATSASHFRSGGTWSAPTSARIVTPTWYGIGNVPPHPGPTHWSATLPSRTDKAIAAPQPTTFLPRRPHRLNRERPGRGIRGPPYLARYEKPRTQLSARRNRAIQAQSACPTIEL